MPRQSLVATCVGVLWAGLAAAQTPVSADLVPDARSLGMGRAFTSIATGPHAAYWNPAALGLGRPGHLVALGSSPYVDLLPGFDNNVFLTTGGLLWQSQRVGIGGNFNFLNYGEAEGALGTSFDYTAHVGVGVEVLRWPFRPSTSAREPTGPEVRLGLGANLKRFYAEFWNNRIFDPTGPLVLTATEYDMDFGLLLVARSRTTSPGYAGVRLGAVVSNAFDRQLSYENGNSDPLGRSLRTGLTVEGALGPRALCGPLLEARGSFETRHYFGNLVSKAELYFGAEVVAIGLLAVRVGYIDWDDNFQESTAGLGIAWDEDERWGFSLDLANLPASDDFPSDDRVQYAVAGWYRFGADALLERGGP